MHRSDTPSSVGSDDSSPAKKRPGPRQRRSYVKAACNSCRSRKVACDGTRPVCHNCTKKGLSCDYVTLDAHETQTSALKRKVQELENDLHDQIDFMNHLASVSDDVVLNLVRQMRSFGGGVNLITDGVADGLLKRLRPSEEQALIPSPATIQFHIDFEIELSARFPDAYPVLDPINTSSISINGLFAQKSNFPPLRTGLLKLPRHSAQQNRMPLTPPEETWAVGPVRPPSHLDERLNGLHIEYWTSTPITDEFAASVISLYLQVEHPFHGFIDSDLFLRDLVECRSEFCSPFLVAALMFFGCQLYAAVDRRSSGLCDAFFAQAEMLWKAEGYTDSLNTAVALQLFSLGCLVKGKDHLSVQALQEGRAMAERLHLFDIPPTIMLEERYNALPREWQRATSHAAWGIYVYLTYHAFFYEDEGVHYPPMYPIPGLEVDDPFIIPEVQVLPKRASSHSSSLFVALCQLCVIAQHVATAYYADLDISIANRIPMDFVELKYRELLGWAEQLPFELKRENERQPEVLVLHIFFHVIILSVFRPFLGQTDQRSLMSFSSSGGTPQSVFNASIEQIKRLILVTRVKYPHSISPILASAGHVHLCTTVTRNKAIDPDWRFYFFLCVAYYQDAHIRYALFELSLQGVLALAMVHDAISGQEAKKIMEGQRRRGRHHRAPDQGVALFTLDFDQALSDRDNAKTCSLASKFEELTVYDEQRRASIPF